MNEICDEKNENDFPASQLSLWINFNQNSISVIIVYGFVFMKTFCNSTLPASTEPFVGWDSSLLSLPSTNTLLSLPSSSFHTALETNFANEFHYSHKWFVIIWLFAWQTWATWKRIKQDFSLVFLCTLRACRVNENRNMATFPFPSMSTNNYKISRIYAETAKK